VKQRGRKSEQQTATLNVIEGGFAGVRPDPPADLTTRQQEIWRATCHDEPIAYFSTAATQELLKDYCFHREEAERAKLTISQFPTEGLKSEKGRKAYGALSRSLDIHVRAAALMATKLRLTNQSRYTPMAAATASRNTLKGQKPWEI
jgi:hypothetical protein